MKEEIRERYQDAVRYDGMMGKLFPGYDQLPRLILSHLRPRLGPGARVLDVGCGTGTALAAFASHQPDWSLVGVDPAPPMLGLAQAKVDEMGAAGRVSRHAGTLDGLAEGAPFDAAVTILVEHLQPDDGAKLRLLEGIAGRLAPGGWLVLAGLHGDLATAPAQDSLEAWLHFLDLMGFPEEVRSGVRHKATVEDSLVPESRILELLGQAGFTDPCRIYQAHLLGAWLARRSG